MLNNHSETVELLLERGASANDRLPDGTAALSLAILNADFDLAARLLDAAPRLTNDVDAVIWIDDERWPEMIGAAGSFAIGPRRADVLEFAARTRVLLLAHASGVSIDVSCGALPFEQTLIERATRVDIGALSVRVAQPQDLLVMKAWRTARAIERASRRSFGSSRAWTPQRLHAGASSASFARPSPWEWAGARLI